MLRVACRILALLLLLFAATPAHAAEIRDGDEFAIAVEPPHGRVCIAYPESARDPVACAGVAIPPPEPAPANPGVRNVVTAIVVLDQNHLDSTAVLVLSRVALRDAEEPDPQAAEDFAIGMTNGMRKDFPNARVNGGARRAELRTVQGLKVARAVFDLEGLPAEDRGTEHQIGYAVWAKDAVYMVLLVSGREHAAAVDALADQSSRSIRVAHPAPRGPAGPGYFLAFIGVAGIASFVVGGYFLTRRRGAAKAPAAPPLGP
jgi:hypothetical protein